MVQPPTYQQCHQLPPPPRGRSAARRCRWLDWDRRRRRNPAPVGMHGIARASCRPKLQRQIPEYSWQGPPSLGCVGFQGIRRIACAGAGCRCRSSRIRSSSHCSSRPYRGRAGIRGCSRSARWKGARLLRGHDRSFGRAIMQGGTLRARARQRSRCGESRQVQCSHHRSPFSGSRSAVVIGRHLGDEERELLRHIHAHENFSVKSVLRLV